jgi:hypothetical protein
MLTFSIAGKLHEHDTHTQTANKRSLIRKVSSFDFRRACFLDDPPRFARVEQSHSLEIEHIVGAGVVVT